MTIGATTEQSNEGRPVDATTGTSGDLPAHPSARGFDVGRVRVRYLKSTMQMGWGHDEGDSASRTLFELSSIYEADRRTAFRIILGRHSIWLFFKASGPRLRTEVIKNRPMDLRKEADGQRP